MNFETDIGHQITARKLMELMLYDNGCIRGCEPDRADRYPKKHFDAITKACEIFFEAHPELLTDTDLENIACGEYNENQEKYGQFIEYHQLEEALFNYFEIM